MTEGSNLVTSADKKSIPKDGRNQTKMANSSQTVADQLPDKAVIYSSNLAKGVRIWRGKKT